MSLVDGRSVGALVIFCCDGIARMAASSAVHGFTLYGFVITLHGLELSSLIFNTIYNLREGHTVGINSRDSRSEFDLNSEILQSL